MSVEVQAEGRLEDSDFEDLDVCVDEMNRPQMGLTDEQRRARNRRRRDRRKKHSHSEQPPAGATVQPTRTQRPRRKANAGVGHGADAASGPVRDLKVEKNILDMDESDVHRLRLREKLRGRIKEGRESRLSSTAITAREEKSGKTEGDGADDDENERLLSSLGSFSNLGGQKVSKRTLQRNLDRMPAAVRNVRSKTMDQASWKGLSGQVGKALGDMMLQPTADASS